MKSTNNKGSLVLTLNDAVHAVLELPNGETIEIKLGKNAPHGRRVLIEAPKSIRIRRSNLTPVVSVVVDSVIDPATQGDVR